MDGDDEMFTCDVCGSHDCLVARDLGLIECCDCGRDYEIIDNESEKNG